MEVQLVTRTGVDEARKALVVLGRLDRVEKHLGPVHGEERCRAVRQVPGAAIHQAGDGRRQRPRPEPVGGQPSPQSNDVDVDRNGLIYLIDRNRGFDILEFTG